METHIHNHRGAIVAVALFACIIGGVAYQHNLDLKALAGKEQLLHEASSTIAKLSVPECDQPVATFKAVAAGTSTDRIHAGTFEVLSPDDKKGQRLEGFVYHPFEVGDVLTQCVNIVVSKP